METAISCWILEYLEKYKIIDSKQYGLKKKLNKNKINSKKYEIPPFLCYPAMAQIFQIQRWEVGPWTNYDSSA